MAQLLLIGETAMLQALPDTSRNQLLQAQASGEHPLTTKPDGKTQDAPSEDEKLTVVTV